ncbi:MAG: carboxypeptidase-like regulatory domain-containing protein, partial [Planctomycetota bacterium]
MKNSKLLLALFAILLAAGAAFLASKAPDPGRTREAAAGPAPLPPVPSQPQEKPAPSPEDPEEPEERVALQDPAEPEPLPLPGEENFELADAQWIRGQVVAPPATPPDLSLEVVAVALARGEIVTDPGKSLSGDRSILEFFERDGRAISRRSVSLGLGAGAFELPMPATADRAALFVDGQYLYLKTAEIVELSTRDESSDPIELRAELGSSLHIVVQPPPGVAADSIAGTAVQLVGLLDSDLFQQDEDRSMKRREARWVPGEPIVWRGLPEGLRISLTASHPDHVDASLMVTRLLEARERRVELQLGSGETLLGQVTDEEGLGIADATLVLRIDSRSSGLLHMSSAFLDLTEEPIVLQTKPDGSFELRGLEPGTIEIEVTKAGWSKATVQELSLPRDEPLEIQLSRGERIAGRVQWPDGSPAVGARVAVRSELSQSTHYGETNLQGRFLISGLVPGPLIVHAELDQRTRSDDAMKEEVAPTVADR